METELLFAANGETYGALILYMREIDADGTPNSVLIIDGLIEANTDHCEKDLLDKQMLIDGMA